MFDHADIIHEIKPEFRNTAQDLLIRENIVERWYILISRLAFDFIKDAYVRREVAAKRGIKPHSREDPLVTPISPCPGEQSPSYNLVVDFSHRTKSWVGEV